LYVGSLITKTAIKNKKHLKNVGPIRHCEPPYAHSPDVAAVLSRAACASMSTTTTTTTTRDRGDRYGPMEWAQKVGGESDFTYLFVMCELTGTTAGLHWP